ncbi:UPF0481 protein At3g47200-like [Lotus japonicus]|uniref:UPF0481 protein At3g47200-like n=1 Tax=Lotus japonicus TaxID=34305 RepID=UPI002586BBED|nr:UPF0481 protein At3g47200-like [Lotus japonicus]
MSKLEEKEGVLNDWKTEFSENLELVVLPEMSAVQEQCIYLVPPEIRQLNPKAFTPQVVCIGPFHRQHGSGLEGNYFMQMEELKLKYLKGFLHRTHLNVKDLVLKLEECETKIRSSYAMTLNLDSNELIKIILVDACFIIEHFLRCYMFENWEENDPLFLKPWLLVHVHSDLLLLENQLPFFVLDDIYNLSGMNMTFFSFLSVTFQYFGQYNRQNILPEGFSHPKHLTDILRTFIIPSSFDFEIERDVEIQHVYSATQLSEAGLVFKASEDEHKSLLDIDLNEGVLTMPHFRVHDITEVFMTNILVFEQCHHREAKYMSQYFWILGFLIKTEKDVDILVDKKIIVDLIGDAKEVVTVFRNLRKNVSLPSFGAKYKNICMGLNDHFDTNPWNKYMSIFKHDYFNTPWKIASTTAAVLLLLLTLIQTVCSVIQVVQGSKPN